MALKKSQLYRSLWSSCDELRGGMDASLYKDYVLTLLFMKYVSDKFAGQDDALIEVPKGGSFSDMAKLKGDTEIGDKINKIIAKLAEANDLQGVITVADFNDPDKLGKDKEMVERLSKLVGIFEGLDFTANRAEGDDLLGDAYEYLMRHFATESGKSKGQFYTPAEVSRIMAKVVGVNQKTRPDQTIYDPTCGSGSLLLKAADEALPKKVTIYGQENDLYTWALARMNMILHGHETAELWKDNTLSSPHFKNPDGRLKTFDFAVSNPPFSMKAWSSGLDPVNDEFKRFELGVPPDKNGDYAFLLHLAKSLKSTGKGAIILPHGVLFRGNKEADIRKNLVQHGLIKGIIGLPPNLFYGTSIPACIVVVDKENAQARTGVFMIDASRGFKKDGNKNRLREQDIHKIVDAFSKQAEIPRYSRMVPVAEIGGPANDFNLNIPRYIDPSEPEDLQDLDAHLRGGIPERDVDALAGYWKVFPSMRKILFGPGDRKGYLRALVQSQKVKVTIVAHPEYASFAAKAEALFKAWRSSHEPTLRRLKAGSKPKAVIVQLSEDLLHRFGALPLVDAYDVYERLMDYWNNGTSVMQDDVYLILSSGWAEAAKPRAIAETKNKNLKEEPDLEVAAKKYKMDLIPPALVVDHYFAADKATIGKLEIARELAARALEEFIEENVGDEGLLADARNDKGSVTRAATKERLRAANAEKESKEECAALENCLNLFEKEAEASRAFTDAQAALDVRVLAQYAKLSEAEVKELVVSNKWFASIWMEIRGEIQRLTQNIARRVKELDERYAAPLPKLQAKERALTSKVEAHLKRMGLVWA